MRDSVLTQRVHPLLFSCGIPPRSRLRQRQHDRDQQGRHHRIPPHLPSGVTTRGGPGRGASRIWRDSCPSPWSRAGKEYSSAAESSAK